MFKKILIAILLAVSVFTLAACGGTKVDLENDDLYGTWHYYAEDNALQVSAEFDEDGSGHFHSVYGGITTADYDFKWVNDSGSITITWDNEGTENSYTLTATKNGEDPIKLTGKNDLALRKNQVSTN